MNLYVEMKGHLVPLRDCNWLRLDPDGHCIGMLVGDGATTPSQCHKEFTSTQANRAREVRQGYTHVLVHRDSAESKAGYACHMGKCSHNLTQDTLPLDGK